MEQKYKQKTLISTLFLFFQSGYSAVLGFLANLILTIVGSPQVFGIYITVLSIVAILNYFSDIGLAAALIQREEISEDDLKTSFTVQQFLVTILISIGFFFAADVKKFYQLPQVGLYLYYAILISFFLSSLKTIPSVLLERKIEFQKIVIVQMVESTFFYLVVIFLAVLKLEILSFVFAVLIRSIVGLVLIYYFSFWMPRLGFSKKSFKNLIAFGLPFQANSFLALIKDDLMTLFLGKILGFEKLGYIGFAKKWAEAPIRIIMDNLSKVVFPLMARFQKEKEKLKKIMEKILFYQSLAVLPATIGLMLVLPKLTLIIPKYQKWQPAIPIFYLFCLAAIFSSYSTPFTNFFNSIGQIKKSFFLMIFWTLATWVFTPIFIIKWGILGFPLVLFLLSLSFIYVVYLAKTIINFKFIEPVFPSFISTLIMAGGVFVFLRINLPPLASLIGGIVFGIILYSVSLVLIFKIDFLKLYRSFYE